MSPDIAKVPRGEKGVCGQIYPQLLLCPYSKQDKAEEFYPLKPLNFDMVETWQVTGLNPISSYNPEIADLKQTVTFHQLRLKNNDPWNKTFSGQK